jgi:hypothetical protein
MESRRSLRQNNDLRDKEMSFICPWAPYKYLAGNWKYDLVMLN